MEQLYFEKGVRGVKMKKIERLFPVLLAIIMVIVCSATAFATDSGMITVNGTTTGQTCDIYRMFCGGYSQTGSYAVDPGWNNFFCGKGAEYITDKNNSAGTLKPVDFGGMRKYINITEGNMSDFAKKASDYAVCRKPNTSQKADGTCIKFSGLGYGYYLVFPKGVGCSSKCHASVCCITPSAPGGTVNEKTEYPSIDKVVDDNTVDIGQTVNYTIKGRVPDTTGYDAYQYRLEDKLSAGLTFNKDVEVFIDGNKISANPVYSENGFTLSISMKDYQDKIGKAVEVKYSAVVNKDAVMGEAGNANKATLTYSNNPKNSCSTATTPPEIVKVYTAGIKIFKYTKSGMEEKPLADAKFVLKDKDEKYYRFTPASESSAEKVEWISDRNSATVVASGNDGSAYFRGLEFGEYYIEEIAAPEGYNLLTSPVSITVDHKAACAVSAVKIENKKGPELPETGGIGTVIFYVVGGLMILSAIVIMVIRRKRV